LPEVGVFLAYASKKGTAFIDRMLYLPKEWANDTERRVRASVPEATVFRDKAELAEHMLERASSRPRCPRDGSWRILSTAARTLPGGAGGTAKAVYVVMVPKTNTIPLDGRKKKIEQHVERLPEEAFSEVHPHETVAARARRAVSFREAGRTAGSGLFCYVT
jgi:hypothetical protein